MKIKTFFLNSIFYIVMLAITLLMLFPIIYAVFGSFKSTIEFLSGGAKLLPEKWEVQNYAIAWQTADFSTYTMNSIKMSLGVVLITLFVASMGAYVLCRSKLKINSTILSILGLVMFVPSVVRIFPVFKMIQTLRLSNTLWGVIIALAAAGLPFSVILMTSYMKDISKELDESAKIDGATFFQIYLKVILPISKPIMATIALISFKNSWNAYLMPLALTLSKPKLRPLTVGVISLKDVGEGISSWNLMIAGTVISIMPMILVYIFMNKYFVSGLTAGSVKG